MGDLFKKTDSRKARQGGVNPFDFESPNNSLAKGLANAPSSPNPFDADEDTPIGSIKSPTGNSNPFKGISNANPFDDLPESSNPFDTAPTARHPSMRHDEGSNPFDEPSPPKPTVPKLSQNQDISAIKGRMSHESSLVVTSLKSSALNPFDEETNDRKQDAPILHMIPPREARSSSVVVPVFVEGEVSCVILASCTSFQIMKNPKEHAVYTLTITATLSMKNAIPFSWSVKRRNKQFETLHASLSQTLDTSLLPPLPKKTWTRSLDPAYLETRRQAFDRYIQAVIAEYGENTIVCTWLCDSFHKMLLPFLHKQMEDRVTTDQLRHHLSAAIIREHDLEQSISHYTEREKDFVQQVAEKENERVHAERKSEEFKGIAERAHHECDALRHKLRTQTEESVKLAQQMETMQEELKQTIEKLKEKPAPATSLPSSSSFPAAVSSPASSSLTTVPSSVIPPVDRRASVTDLNVARKLSITSSVDEMPIQRKSSVSGVQQSNLLSPSPALLSPLASSDPASIIGSLDKPLFEPQQTQWTCSSCSTENKLPIVQCISCRLVKPLSFPIELTITNIHKVQRNAKEDPFAEYLLQVKFGTFCYLVRRRFSDFEKLHDSLVSFFGKMDTMPSLPKTQLSMFGGGAQSFDPTFLQQRRSQLQTFLHGVVKHSLFFHCGPLCGWLVLDSVDGLFGPLLRSASTQRFAAEQLAEHVKELEATVSTKTQLLVETLELRNRVEEALEAEKTNFAQLTATLTATTKELEGQREAMQNHQHSSHLEIERLQDLLVEQTRKAQEMQISLEERLKELASARAESESKQQEVLVLAQQLSASTASLQAEKANSISLEQQLESALNRSADIARELAAAEYKIKNVTVPVIEEHDNRSAFEKRGVADENSVVSTLSLSRKSSPLLTAKPCGLSPSDTIISPQCTLDSNSLSVGDDSVSNAADVHDSSGAVSEACVDGSPYSERDINVQTGSIQEHGLSLENHDTETSFHLPSSANLELARSTESMNPFD